MRRTSSVRMSRSSKINYCELQFQSQFTEQLKCLESRMNIDSTILTDLNEFYKRRSLVEQEYADSLSKLVQNFHQKLAADKMKRQNWPKYSSLDLINTLIVSSQRSAHSHYVMANIFNQQMTQRIIDLQDDVIRLYKQSKELLQKCQQNVLNSCTKLHKDYKAYANCYQLSDESRKTLERSKEKMEKEEKRYVSKKKEFTKSSKFKKLNDDFNEKKEIYESKRLACSQARNEYIIQLAAVNKAIEKFFSQEIHDVLECMSYGYHNNLSRAILNHINCEEALVTSHKTIVDMLHATMNNIDARRDTGVFLESHQPAFSRLPEQKFQMCKDDQVSVISVDGSLKENLISMASDLKTNLEFTIVEVDEIWKTIEEAAKNLNNLISQQDYDVADIFISSKLTRHQRSKESLVGTNSLTIMTNSIDSALYTVIRNATRVQRIEQETFYIECLDKYLMKNYKYHTAAAKLERLIAVLGDFLLSSGESSQQDDLEASLTGSNKIARQLTRKTQRRLGVQELQTKPRLFGGSLEDYIERTGEAIPLVIRTCVQVINQYGMHHQGVFRIPGSQTEINEYRELFEKDDKMILKKKFGPRDVNSIAGLLKLYFRELVEPLFPNCIFNRLIECSKEDVTFETRIANFSSVINELSDSVFVVLRYLFAFLNHLSDYAEDNMMDPQNLAICLGPCLMPVPSDLSHFQFEYQPHVNHIVRLFIEKYKDVFNPSSPTRPMGPLYERFQPMTTKRFMRSISDDAILDHDNVSDLSFESPTFDLGSSTNILDEKDSKDSSNDDMSGSVKDFGNNTITRCQSNRSPDSKNDSFDSLLIRPPLMRKLSDSEISPMTYAVSIADYKGATHKELSFCKGQTVKLYRKLSQHWWEGCVNAAIHNRDDITPFRIGLIPNSYLRFDTNLKDFLTKRTSTGTDCKDLTPMKQDFREDNLKISEHVDEYKNESTPVVMEDKKSDDTIDADSPSVQSALQMFNFIEPNDKDSPMNRKIESALDVVNFTDDFESTNDDEDTFETTFAQIMQGFVDLEQQNTIRLKSTSRYRLEEATIALEKKFVSPLSKHAPDLVRDLVSKKNVDVISNGIFGGTDATVNKMTTSADMFAEQGQNTVRKKVVFPDTEVSSSPVPQQETSDFSEPQIDYFVSETPVISLEDCQSPAKSQSFKIGPPIAPKPKRN